MMDPAELNRYVRHRRELDRVATESSLLLLAVTLINLTVVTNMAVVTVCLALFGCLVVFQVWDTRRVLRRTADALRDLDAHLRPYE